MSRTVGKPIEPQATLLRFFGNNVVLWAVWPGSLTINLSPNQS